MGTEFSDTEKEYVLCIDFVKNTDIELLHQYDKHISRDELENVVRMKRIYIAKVNGHFAGWLRYNLFWDNTPFMNMLYIIEEYRGKGFGRQLVEVWEEQMSNLGYKELMTSTQSDEYAQHFYFKLGYEAIGGFRPKNEPYEVIFCKYF